MKQRVSSLFLWQNFSKATYQLRVHQFTSQQVGKGGKRTNFIVKCPLNGLHVKAHSNGCHQSDP